MQTALAAAQLLKDQIQTIRQSEADQISHELGRFLRRFRRDHNNLLTKVNRDIAIKRGRDLRRNPTPVCDFCRGVYGSRPCQHGI